MLETGQITHMHDEGGDVGEHEGDEGGEEGGDEKRDEGLGGGRTAFPSSLSSEMAALLTNLPVASLLFAIADDLLNARSAPALKSMDSSFLEVVRSIPHVGHSLNDKGDRERERAHLLLSCRNPSEFVTLLPSLSF